MRKRAVPIVSGSASVCASSKHDSKMCRRVARDLGSSALNSSESKYCVPSPSERSALIRRPPVRLRQISRSGKLVDCGRIGLGECWRAPRLSNADATAISPHVQTGVSVSVRLVRQIGQINVQRIHASASAPFGRLGILLRYRWRRNPLEECHGTVECHTNRVQIQACLADCRYGPAHTGFGKGMGLVIAFCVASARRTRPAGERRRCASHRQGCRYSRRPVARPRTCGWRWQASVRRQAPACFPPQARAVGRLDVGRAEPQGEALCPPTAALEAWMEAQRDALKTGRLDSVLAALALYTEGPETADDQAPVRRCHRYLSDRRNQRNYGDVLANDLPIGSGEIESAHRYIAQQRLKWPGAWRRIDHAEYRLALRINRRNGDWSAYWHTFANTPTPANQNRPPQSPKSAA